MGIQSEVKRVVEELEKYIIAKQTWTKRALYEVAKTVVLAKHGKKYNILLVGPPGVGKSYITKLASEITGVPYVRITGTPDVVPSDVIGDIHPASLVSPKMPSTPLFGPVFFADPKWIRIFREGKAYGEYEFEFKEEYLKAKRGVLHVDEINRFSTRTLSMLTQMMAEDKVTIRGLSKPFEIKVNIVATANPFGELHLEGIQHIPTHIMNRFDKVVPVPMQNEEEQIAIIMNVFAPRWGYKVTEDGARMLYLLLERIKAPDTPFSRFTSVRFHEALLINLLEIFPRGTEIDSVKLAEVPMDVYRAVIMRTLEEFGPNVRDVYEKIPDLVRGFLESEQIKNIIEERKKLIERGKKLKEKLKEELESKTRGVQRVSKKELEETLDKAEKTDWRILASKLAEDTDLDIDKEIKKIEEILKKVRSGR